MAKLIVSKFGGSSMGDAACMRRSAEISKNQKSSVVLVSATYGTTNALIELTKIAQTQIPWEECETLYQKIRSNHFKIAEDLNLPKTQFAQLEGYLQYAYDAVRGVYLLKDCSLKAMDSIMALGELMSSVLFTQSLKEVAGENQVEWFDVRDVLRTDNYFSQGAPDIEETRKLAVELMTPKLNQGKVLVTQGFIGRTFEGQTTTLGRGGSDYSAALIAEALRADILEIWTDVAGIASTDPRICKQATPIKEISFQEAAELAAFGAKILHPATLAPAMRVEIPVFVGSSFAPNDAGTWIKFKVENAPLVRALAVKKNQTLMTISTPKMLNSFGYLSKMFEIFNKHRVSVDAITTSEISVALTVDKATATNKALLADLNEIAEVSVETDLALVSLIGNNINHTPKLAQAIFTNLNADAEAINVRMICLGASKHNFCFLVNENQGDEAIRRLHRSFLEA